MNAIGVGAPTAPRSAAITVSVALDCYDREAMSFLATTAGISGEDVRDLMVAAHRFGRINRLPITIEWLSDNGSYAPPAAGGHPVDLRPRAPLRAAPARFLPNWRMYRRGTRAGNSLRRPHR